MPTISSACALSAALAFALVGAPAGAVERSGPAERAAAERAEAKRAGASPSAGIAGVDRFSIDSSRIERSERADGMIVVRLNGEGMERSQLQLADGRPVARCASAVDPARLRPSVVPADFRSSRSGRTPRND